MNVFANTKKKQPPVINNNVLESVRGIGSSVGKSVTSEVIGKTGENIVSSIFNPGSIKSGELKPNQNVYPELEKSPVRNANPELQSQKRPRNEEAGLKEKIAAVRQELVLLIKSIRLLNREVEKAVNEEIIDPGIYHLNFLDELKNQIRKMRQNIDDSRTWLEAFIERGKKLKYWGKYKKHGTKWGLSSERKSATSGG